jgi:segregation and condensation protein B
MNREILKTVLESLIFVSEEPISFKQLAELTGVNKNEEMKAALDEIEQDCIAQKRGIVLYEVAGGYQFRTPPESAKYVANLFEGRPQRLTRAALETMAIIAYRQPIVRAEIEKIRGVDTGGVIKTLLERELIRIVSRQDTPGRPALYGTTSKFLEFFGLKSLSDMPDLKEIKELGDAAEEQIADEAPGREPADEDQTQEKPSEGQNGSDE